MNVVLLIPYYISWHYTRGVADFFHASKNLLEFELRYFAFARLTRTFFLPLRRIEKGVVVKDGVVMRFFKILLGMFLRLSTMIIGACAFIVSVLVSFITLLVWIVAPFLLISFLVAGIRVLV